jgi:hypothetical protein
MGEDRSWMYSGWDKEGNYTDEWMDKATAFLDHAFSLSKIVRCPCSRCQNTRCLEDKTNLFCARPPAPRVALAISTQLLTSPRAAAAHPPPSPARPPAAASRHRRSEEEANPPAAAAAQRRRPTRPPLGGGGRPAHGHSEEEADPPAAQRRRPTRPAAAATDPWLTRPATPSFCRNDSGAILHPGSHAARPDLQEHSGDRTQQQGGASSLSYCWLLD